MADISKIKVLDGTTYDIKDATARSSIPAAATAAPLMDGTAAVGSATKYAREDHRHPRDTNKIDVGAKLFTTNPFVGVSSMHDLYISKIDNAFYAADKRFNVSATVNGTAFSNVAQFFDGNYEGNSQMLKNGATGIITMDFSNLSGSKFPGYPYGYIYISFYFGTNPKSISGRVYNNYSGQGVGWKDITFSSVTSNNLLWVARQAYYGLQTLEITIVGETENSYGYTSPCEIEMYLDRPDPQYTPFLSKYAAETLYYPLTAPSFNGSLNGNATSANSATRATQDESGNNIKASYASAISISDHTITLKNKNGASLGTVTVPDNTVSPATATPLVAGTGAVGTATKYAREDHVHPAQTTVNGHTVNSDVPANAVFTDTHRPIQVNGAQVLGDNTTALNLKAGSNVTVTNSSGTVTIAATDTTYESKAAASGGTAVSLVTTGEKYTWNNKSNLALGTTSSTAFRGDYGNAAYTHAVTNKGSAFSSGLYKITTNSEGHVTAATAVAKSDITALGIPAQDTTYESKTAISGGTALSLVTTGEKYTWNSKGTYSKPSGGIPASDLASNVVSRIFPSGGSSGQFLAKNSVTDYDLGWADQTTYVTASVSGALHSIDKTYDELRTLINNGNHVILTYYGDPYQLDSIKTSGTIKFARYYVDENDSTVSKATFNITKSGTNTYVSRVLDTISVPRVFVGATVFDVYNDGEGGYTVSCTGAEDMGDIFMAGTTQSLSLMYHKVEMGEPGVDGNLEQYELVSCYTTNEYSSEIGDYMYTGHLVFNSVDTTSSKIKTFVISSVLYMYPYFDNATITYSESSLGGSALVAQNVQVAANAWSQNATYASFPYRAAIPLTGVTSSMIPEVIFSPDDAISGNYAPVADTATNTVYIYAKSEGAVAITIPTVSAR